MYDALQLRSTYLLQVSDLCEIPNTNRRTRFFVGNTSTGIGSGYVFSKRSRVDSKARVAFNLISLVQ